MPCSTFCQCRRSLSAHILHIRTSGVKMAAGRRIGRIRQIALQDNPFLSLRRIRNRDSRQKRFRVGVARVCKQLVALCQLHDFAQVHDRDPVADMLDGRQAVGDENVGQL